MKIKTKQITVTAIMLAICLVSQFFKNLSVYITGPIINAALILTILYAGMACGIILSSPTHTTRMIFPIMIHGNIAGIAAITGLPVMKNDVTGVIMLRIMPHAIPA